MYGHRSAASGKRTVREYVFAEVNGKPGAPTAGLTLQTTGGASAGFKLSASKGNRPIRVAVGEPGKRSTVWRVWANPKKADVYVASRFTAKTFKISLHESGDWRIQWITPEHGEHVAPSGAFRGPEEGRVIDQWSRPDAVENGWTDALSIFVPGADLPDIPNDDVSVNDVQWVTAPGPLELVELRLFLVSPRGGPFNLTPAVEAGDLAFVNGFRVNHDEVLLVFAATEEVDSKRANGLARVRARNQKMVPGWFDRSPELGPRSFVVEREESGRRNIWDLAPSK